MTERSEAVREEAKSRTCFPEKSVDWWIRRNGDLGTIHIFRKIVLAGVHHIGYCNFPSNKLWCLTQADAEGVNKAEHIAQNMQKDYAKMAAGFMQRVQMAIQ